MAKHSEHGGKPRYIHLRASYELEENEPPRRRSAPGAFAAGMLKAMLLSVLPILLVVGYLNYSANGWHNFAAELLAHIELILVPLAIAGVLGGIIAIRRR